MKGQPGPPGGAQMNPFGFGGTKAVTCATVTGLAPVSRLVTIAGNWPAPAAMPSVATRLAVEPDSATAKITGANVAVRISSRPAGASKPERSPTIASG